MKINIEMPLKITDYTKDGKCSSCGKCCVGYLPVSRKELDRIRRYVKDNRIKPVNTHPLKIACPFYNRDQKRCEVYEVRPRICRTFQCSKDLNTIRSERDEINFKYNCINLWDKAFA